MDVIGIITAVAFGGLAIGGIVAFVRACRKPQIKQSRSDNDLASLNPELV